MDRSLHARTPGRRQCRLKPVRRVAAIQGPVALSPLADRLRRDTRNVRPAPSTPRRPHRSQPVSSLSSLPGC